ncbi:MAG: DUF481 domain-containing protein [Verrucomicrobiota bacterium]|nr:DUF481 domain-containing protein [Verrucomicrobiota bacterium]
MNSFAVRTALLLPFLTLSAGDVNAQDASTNQPPKPKWETSAAVGATVTQGNSDSTLLTMNILSRKNWDKNELSLGADAAYGETENVKSSETAHAFAQYNRLWSDRMFGYLRLDGLHDDIADIDYRLTVSPGLGYYLVKNEITKLSVEAGPAFIYEKQGGDTEGYMTLRLAERFEHQFNDKVRMWQSAEYLPQVDNFENFLLNAEVGVEAVLTKRVSLRVFAVDNYDNEPAPGRKENDLKFVTAIAYTFK